MGDVIKFPCSGCGACCKRVGKTKLMPDRGDGACIYLDENNKCKIYDNRPMICNIERMFNLRENADLLPIRGMTKTEYFKMNAEACNAMIKEDGLDERFLLPMPSDDV